MRSPASKPQHAVTLTDAPGLPDGSLRIAMYTDSAVVGGAESVLRAIVGAVPPSACLVLIGTNQAVLDYVRADGQQTAMAHTSMPARKWRLWEMWRIREAFRNARADLVVLNDISLLSSRYAAAAALSLRGPAVVAIEHLPTVGAEMTWRRLLVKRLIARRLDAVITVSEAGQEVVQRALRVRRSKVHVIRNGALDEWADARPMRTPRTTMRVLSAGRLEAVKAVDVLLRATAAVPEVQLVVAGEGAERAALEALAAGLGLSERIAFVGWLPSLHQSMLDADVFCLTSRAEGLPLVVLQAMLAGLPVVASNVDGVPEAVLHRVTGELVNPDDVDGVAAALQRLVQDPLYRLALGSKGRERAVTHFLQERMVSDYWSLFARISRTHLG